METLPPGAVFRSEKALTRTAEFAKASPVTAYDKLDWHYDAAVAAGQPPENAFAHIGFYLAWLIRHDLHDPTVFPASHVAAVKNGEMTGSDLADDIDTKLVPDVMNREGRAFSDARYARFLEEYASLFANVPEYGVIDDAPNYARVGAVIDRLYAAWVADGRPEPPPSEPDLPWTIGLPAHASFEIPVGMPREAIEAFTAAISSLGIRVEPAPDEIGGVASGLEQLIPMDITDPPPRIHSVRAKQWGSSLLNRALKRLDVRPDQATVVVGMGGSGARTLAITLYELPGVPADRLMAEFTTVIFLPTRGTWATREMAGRVVNWAVGDEATVVFWARDGLVVHVAGEAADVETAIPRLP